VDIKKVLKLSPEEVASYWIMERESIRLQRLAKKPKPWTDDEILQSYRFCNVRRMDDKVSRWLEVNWYRPHFGHKNMLLACVLARHFNRPSTLGPITELVFAPGRMELNKIRKKILAMRDFGNKVFNSAYIIGNAGVTSEEAAGFGNGKVEILFEMVFDPIHSSPPEIDPCSMQQSVANLTQYAGFGTFMAGQVISDLRWAIDGDWDDRHDWAPQGPGSTRGLARYLGMESVKKNCMISSVFQVNFQQFMEDMRSELPEELRDRLEAMDYQNCLCEYDKYMRTLHKEGTPKNKYEGK